jgi:acetyl-CoA carboxylase carboxyltransferase component
MNGAGQAALGLYVWPGAEIGFMDPDVGVNVAYGTKLAGLEDPEEQERERQRLVAAVAEGTSPYEAAGVLRVDEVIDPAETRRVLAEDLAVLANRPLPPPQARTLASWPSC